MTTYLIAHRADPDGILTHAILERALDDEPYLRHVYVDHPDMVSSLESVAMDRPGEVVIADMSLNHSYKPAVKRVSETHRPLTWIDHHQGSIDEHSFLEQHCSRVVVSLQKCAAELAQETYLPEEAYARHLARVGHAHDFEVQKDPHLLLAGRDLQTVIASGYNLDDLVSDLATGKAWDPSSISRLNTQYRVVIEEMALKREHTYQELEETLDERIIAGKDVILAHSNPLLYWKDASTYLKGAYNPDYFVISFEGKTNVLFIGNGNVGTSAVDFCQSMGGGGRDNGGGFELDHEVTQTTYPEDKEWIAGRLTEFLARWQKR